jgi:hypothetical protein
VRDVPQPVLVTSAVSLPYTRLPVIVVDISSAPAEGAGEADSVIQSSRSDVFMNRQDESE